MEENRFYLLDVARGVCAFSVIVYHFQWFYWVPRVNLPADFSRTVQPFYNILWLFYEHGIYAIHFFFVLSGFIFFALYREQIHSNKVNAKTFFILRFSRLYPLHFITLIFVALFQRIFMKLNGDFIVFYMNDLKHFVLHLFFMNSWGLEEGHSFNGLTWSVSSEIVAYSVFFLFAKFGFKKFRMILFILLISYPILLINHKISYGLFGFFVGGGTFLVFDILIKKYPLIIKQLIPLILVEVILIPIIAGHIENETLSKMVIVGGFFSGIVLLLALIQNIYSDLGKNISIIGGLTYSTYLMQFPMQIILIGFSRYYNYQLDLGKWFFIVWIFSVATISYIVYKKFEIPAQRYIRQKYLNKPKRERGG